MASFAEQLKAFGTKASGLADEVVRESILEVGARLIDRSPVDTSAFQSNWNYGLESRDAFFSAARLHKHELNNLDELPKKAGGFIHFISNAAPYGPALERGSSQQAPQGVVGLTVVEWDQIVAAAAGKVAGGGAGSIYQGGAVG